MLSNVWSIDVPDHSTLNRRIRKLTIPVDTSSNNIYELAIDSTGYRVQGIKQSRLNKREVEEEEEEGIHT